MLTNPKINFKQAILSTFAFFDMFDFPLSREEVEEYLYKLPLDEHQINIYLKNSALLSYSEGLYCLKGREENFFKNQERREIAKKLWKKVNRFREVFNLIPFIRLIAIGNNLAYDNPTKKSDIDLFIITKPDRMFTARIFITILTHLLGARRYKNKIKGRFCLSFYITEDNLEMEKLAIEDDIYLAYWIKTLQPVSGDYQSYIDFIDHNRKLLEQFFKTPINYQKRRYRTNRGLIKIIRTWQENMLSGKFGDKFEEKLKNWQLKRSRLKFETMNEKAKKEASIIIGEKILKFHNIDRRQYYKERWMKTSG